MMIVNYKTAAIAQAEVIEEDPDIKDYTYMLNLRIADMNKSESNEDLQENYNSVIYHLDLLRDVIYKKIEAKKEGKL